MAPDNERYKVAYSLRFEKDRLPALGFLCSTHNLEVLNTTVTGDEVHMLTRFAPEAVDADRDAFGDARYESPKRVVKGVLVPMYDNPAQEIEARKLRAANPPRPPSTAR